MALPWALIYLGFAIGQASETNLNGRKALRAVEEFRDANPEYEGGFYIAFTQSEKALAANNSNGNHSPA